MQSKTDKFERQGYRVQRMEENKFIDCTDNYTNALRIINDTDGSLQKRSSLSIDGEADDCRHLFKIESRRIGGKLVRLGTPIERIHPTLT